MAGWVGWLLEDIQLNIKSERGQELQTIVESLHDFTSEDGTSGWVGTAVGHRLVTGNLVANTGVKRRGFLGRTHFFFEKKTTFLFFCLNVRDHSINILFVWGGVKNNAYIMQIYGNV